MTPMIWHQGIHDKMGMQLFAIRLLKRGHGVGHGPGKDHKD
jgi:hypothetical protein